ncbi:hypothetical protein I656_04075 [Geobacillus sp. WSUCF1]|nr:hypothetical protein I656_04075 [Geobacillus sp. WSUCF1]
MLHKIMFNKHRCNPLPLSNRLNVGLVPKHQSVSRGRAVYGLFFFFCEYCLFRTLFYRFGQLPTGKSGQKDRR